MIVTAKISEIRGSVDSGNFREKCPVLPNDQAGLSDLSLEQRADVRKAKGCGVY